MCTSRGPNSRVDSYRCVFIHPTKLRVFPQVTVPNCQKCATVFLAFLSHTAGLISIMNIENTKCHLTGDSIVQVKMQTQAESEIHGDTKTHTYTMSLRKNVTNLSHYNCDKREPIFTISGRNVAISMPAVFSPWCGTSSEKRSLVWHHFLSKTVIIRMFS